MGKYMRKAKISDEVTLMEFPLGVRTRARTLALQRLQKPQPTTTYLQLRSRRLEKPQPTTPSKPSKEAADPPMNSSSVGSVSMQSCSNAEGENILDLDSRDRNSRETTPCSLIRDSESVGTPGSTTRPISTAINPRTRLSVRRDIPTAREMEEFFDRAEKLQQRIFAEKYNFDPRNECPLPGRYEWVKLD